MTTMMTIPFKIRTGIFQGDSLSLLLLRMVLTPLTNELNRAGCVRHVHRTEIKISHLLYEDDLKLLGRNYDLENKKNC
jgi:hypothetical protein